MPRKSTQPPIKIRGKVKKLQTMTPAKRKGVLEEVAKYYKSGVQFHTSSGTGMIGEVRGGLRLKLTKDKESPDYKFNGDIVSAAGTGCIYNASTDTWGQIIN